MLRFHCGFKRSVFWSESGARMESMKRLFGIALLCSGCQVSFFGGDPIGSLSSGSEDPAAHACLEPDDAHRVRADPDACEERCRIDADGSEDCDDVEIRDGIAVIDMRYADGLIMKFEVCEPTGMVFQLSDSETGFAGGGDLGTSTHNAQIALSGSDLTVRASDGAEVEESMIQRWIPHGECTERTVVVAEQLLYFVEQERGLCGTGLFRVNPPADARGTPDAKWFLALAGSVDGSVEGSGLRSTSLCFW